MLGVLWWFIGISIDVHLPRAIVRLKSVENGIKTRQGLSTNTNMATVIRARRGLPGPHTHTHTYTLPTTNSIVISFRHLQFPHESFQLQYFSLVYFMSVLVPW